MSDPDPSKVDDGGARARGPFYVLIAAAFVPFLALLFPYLVFDDYRRTRALADAGARGVTDPKRRERDRDGMFWAAGAFWALTLVGIVAARATGREGLATALVSFQLLCVVSSGLSIGFSWMSRDKRTDEEKRDQFAVKEAQVQAYFDKRDAQREEAGLAFSEPAVPWVSRQVWRRWFLVRWGPHGWDGGADGPPLGLSDAELGAGEHASPVPRKELDEAPVEEIVGQWKPRRAGKGWAAARESEVGSLEAHQTAIARVPSPFRFPGMSWPVCHERLAVMVWEGNAGLSPDAIGLPMGLPAQIEQLVVAAQGVEPWASAHGWDLNAVFQCCECGRLYWRGYEP